MHENSGDTSGAAAAAAAADSGALRDKSRKMAKKGAPAALQTEVGTDDEWEKILERKGLVLADIYSDWSGPCSGMVSILKKIKMEIGGDNLSYCVAKCDTITSLARFRGKSEPTWMFIRDGLMVNIIFGANCPQLVRVLTKELRKVQKGELPDMALPVHEVSPKEVDRMKAFEEAAIAKRAAKMARIEAEARKKYEAHLAHLLEALKSESIVVLFPWVFTDEEGNKREKKQCPPYTELVDQVLADRFHIEQEIKKDINDDILIELQKECDREFSNLTKHLMTDGKAMILRLKMISKSSDIDADDFLINLLYGDNNIPESPEDLTEGCYVQRNLPPDSLLYKDEGSVESSPDKILNLTTIWIPCNARNKCLALRIFFTKYVDSNYPYEQPESDIPLTVFKYDSTRRKELQVVLDTYKPDVVNFGVFERDKLPNPVLIARSIRYFEELPEKTSYEVFVCVVKKKSPEGFLSFAGIGPYHVSETPEKAIEEANQYFPPEVEDIPEEPDPDVKSDGEEEEEEMGEGEEDEEESPA